jgi:hypothetical protein
MRHVGSEDEYGRTRDVSVSEYPALRNSSEIRPQAAALGNHAASPIGIWPRRLRDELHLHSMVYFQWLPGTCDVEAEKERVEMLLGPAAGYIAVAKVSGVVVVPPRNSSGAMLGVKAFLIMLQITRVDTCTPFLGVSLVYLTPLAHSINIQGSHQVHSF